MGSSTDIPALFFFFAGLFAFLLFVHRHDYYFLTISLLVIAYAGFIRSEMLIVTLLLSFYLITDKNLRSFLWQKKENTISLMLAIFFVALAALSIIVSRFDRILQIKSGSEYVAGRPLFSLQYFISNTASILVNSFSEHGLIIAAAIILVGYGVYQLFRVNKKGCVLLLALMVILFIFYMSVSFGAATHHSRFMLPWLSFLIIFAAIGLGSIFNKILKPNFIIFSVFIIFLTLLLHVIFNKNQYFPSSPHRTTIKEEYARLHFEKQNPSCLYVAFVPYREFLNRYNALSYEALMEVMSRNPNRIYAQPCVVFFESPEVCVITPHSICNVILRQYEWKKVSYPLPTYTLTLPNQKEQATLRASSPPPFYRNKTMAALLKEKAVLSLRHFAAILGVTRGK